MKYYWFENFIFLAKICFSHWGSEFLRTVIKDLEIFGLDSGLSSRVFKNFPGQAIWSIKGLEILGLLFRVQKFIRVEKSKAFKIQGFEDLRA